MGKRTRGSRRSQRRSGGRHSGRQDRRDRRDAIARAPERSELLAAADLAEDELEEADDSTRRQPAPVARSRARASSLLAAKAATEYVYVAQDVRRIVVVAALLFAIMFALWILIVVAKVIRY